MKVGKESVLWISGMEFQRWGEEQLTALNPGGKGLRDGGGDPSMRCAEVYPTILKMQIVVCTLHASCILSHIITQGIQCGALLFLTQYRITSMQSHTRTLIQSESLLFHRVYLLHSQKHWLSYSLIHMVMFSFKMTLPRLTNQQILPLSCCLM